MILFTMTTRCLKSSSSRVSFPPGIRRVRTSSARMKAATSSSRKASISFSLSPHTTPPSIKPERRRTVLVADDDISIHLLAEAALTRDYDVVTAEDGEECLAILRNSAPDIIVLDLNMPVLDGLTVLKTLRGDPRLTHLPVLVLTASGDESSTRAAFEAGATDYLTKPFTIPQLTTRVTTCFAHTVAPSLAKA